MGKLCGKILTSEPANSSFALKMNSTLPTSDQTLSSWHDARASARKIPFPGVSGALPKAAPSVKIVNNASKKRKYPKTNTKYSLPMWGTKIMDLSSKCRCYHRSACTYEPPTCGRTCPPSCCSSPSGVRQYSCAEPIRSIVRAVDHKEISSVYGA